MNQIWAVARQMIAEGVRMKIALVFLVLIGMVVLGLPFSIQGDSTVTGAVQSFLSYGLLTSGFLLSLLTIFLSRSLSDEFVSRQIFLLVSKPIPRWRFIMGKWVGITVLNGVFLSFAGLSIYGMTYWIKANFQASHQKRTADEQRYDREELSNQVLVARHAIRCKVPDFSRPVEAEFQRNLEQGRYADVPDFDPVREKQSLYRKYEARWRIIAPFSSRVFAFHNILCNRSSRERIQLRYKAEITGYSSDEIFRSVWRFGDPAKRTALYDAQVRHVIGRFHTISVPADCVARDHTLKVTFINQNPFPHEPSARNVLEIRKTDGVEILFAVGSFEWNFVRLLVLMMCKLMFLAAVALLAATVFSFPVACLTSMTVYVLAGTRQFLSDSFDFLSVDQASMFSSFKEFVMQSITQGYNLLSWVVPDFGRYDAIDTFVNGRNVTLVWVLQGVADLVLFKTVVVLGLAILLFYRREVAEISF